MAKKQEKKPVPRWRPQRRASLNDKICLLCGRPVPPKASKRGRPKEQHRECVEFGARRNQLGELLYTLRFMPPINQPNTVNAAWGPSAKIRSRVYKVWNDFNPKRMKTSQGDEEYHDTPADPLPIEKEKKKRKVSHKTDGWEPARPYQPGETICEVCGRPVPPKKGTRGRPKEKHRECILFETRLGQLTELLSIIRFMPPVRLPDTVNAAWGPASEVRKSIHEMWKFFNPKRMYESTADTEFANLLRKK